MKFTIPRSTYPVISILILLFLVELFTPKPIDWTKSFESQDKRPFGSYLLKELLHSDLFPKEKVEERIIPVFNYEDIENGKERKIYLYITNQLNMQAWDVHKLLQGVKNGNHLFIAASNLSKPLEDSLDIRIAADLYDFDVHQPKKLQYLENKTLSHDSLYTFIESFDPVHINNFNKDSVLVLGKDQDGKVQLIIKNIGKGSIVLSCQPLAFTNYSLLTQKNADYVAAAFSYLPNLPIVWDEYYKPLRAFRSKSPLRFLLSNSALRFALYLLLFCMLTLLFFQGKRQQRIIPIVQPLANTSLEFIKTLGSVYYTRNNHKDIALKRWKYFRDHIRKRYHLEFESANLRELSTRSGISLKTLEILDQQNKWIDETAQLNNDELVDFHSKLEYIYKNGK